MKQPKSVEPLKYNASLQGNSPEGPLEWSRPAGVEVYHDLNHDEEPDEPAERHGASAMFQKIMGWIDRRMGAHHDEIQMLRRLHKAEKLEISIPHEHAAIEPHLQRYWLERYKRHNRRMLVAGILVAPAAILTIIPGPNVVGLALAYVAWHHWRIVQGVKKVRSGAIEVEVKRVVIANETPHEKTEMESP